MSKVNLTRWRELSPLLDQVLELAEEERRGWLETLRTENADLARELQALLAEIHVLHKEGFLEDDPARLLNETSLDLDATSFVGRQVGSYVIDAEIGRGGMGSVWRASRSDGRFEGHVAIKFVHLSWLGRDGEKRFQREGHLLARLSHASIARLIDAGVLDGSHPYLVMEYVEGEQIDAHCERAALDIDARIRLFLDVLAAVAHAHGHLIVHRDLKPSNVLVTRLGEVKLLDFGIAKLMHPDAGDAGLTVVGTRLGTSYTMAPEQIRGDGVDPRTDIYALGVVLYHLVTGQYPFRAETMTDIERMHLEAPPPRPSQAAAIPLAIDAITLRCMEKTADRRFPSAKAFIEALRDAVGVKKVGGDDSARAAAIYV